MGIYFVDFENVNSNGLVGISKIDLNENDKLVLFYSENAKSVTIDVHKELEKRIGSGSSKEEVFPEHTFLRYMCKSRFVVRIFKIIYICRYNENFIVIYK